MQTITRTTIVLILLTLILSIVPAYAETVNCTPITTIPTVITVQGIYCFTGHLSTAITTGNAIDIQTNNVVLDLNGFKLEEVCSLDLDQFDIDLPLGFGRD